MAFFIAPFLGIAQNFQFQRISINSIDSLEKKQNAYRFEYGYPIGVSKDYFPNREKYKLGQPIVYRKQVKGFKYETSYYFSLPDSTLRLIEYWWEGDSITNPEVYELLTENRKQIALHVSKKGKYLQEAQEKQASEIWQNDLVYVEQFFLANFQRIRVKISWK
ncbi:MAG: hypothetical protein QM737_18760 [Ferruginibacter sp.]